MPVGDPIQSIAQSVQGYAGYRDRMDRQDTLDVLSAHLDGRLVKRVKSFEQQLAIWEDSPEFIESAAKMDELLAAMQKILVQLKDDLEGVSPFREEYVIFEEKVLSDLVRIDAALLETEALFAKLTEQVAALNPATLEQARLLAERLQFLWETRSRRIQALNASLLRIREFLDCFEKATAAQTLGREIFKQAQELLSHYPDRIQSYERLLKTLRDHAPLYQNFRDPEAVRGRYPALKLFLEEAPLVVAACRTFTEGFQPRSEPEIKAREALTEYLGAQPDYETLRSALETACKAKEIQ